MPWFLMMKVGVPLLWQEEAEQFNEQKKHTKIDSSPADLNPTGIYYKFVIDLHNDETHDSIDVVTCVNFLIFNDICECYYGDDD